MHFGDVFGLEALLPFFMAVVGAAMTLRLRAPISSKEAMAWMLLFIALGVASLIVGGRNTASQREGAETLKNTERTLEDTERALENVTTEMKELHEIMELLYSQRELVEGKAALESQVTRLSEDIANKELQIHAIEERRSTADTTLHSDLRRLTNQVEDQLLRRDAIITVNSINALLTVQRKDIEKLNRGEDAVVGPLPQALRLKHYLETFETLRRNYQEHLGAAVKDIRERFAHRGLADPILDHEPSGFEIEKVANALIILSGQLGSLECSS